MPHHTHSHAHIRYIEHSSRCSSSSSSSPTRSGAVVAYSSRPHKSQPLYRSHRCTIDRCMLLTGARPGRAGPGRAVNNRRRRRKADYLTARFMANGAAINARPPTRAIYAPRQTCTTADYRLTHRRRWRPLLKLASSPALSYCSEDSGGHCVEAMGNKRTNTPRYRRGL